MEQYNNDTDETQINLMLEALEARFKLEKPLPPPPVKEVKVPCIYFIGIERGNYHHIRAVLGVNDEDYDIKKSLKRTLDQENDLSLEYNVTGIRHRIEYTNDTPIDFLKMPKEVFGNIGHIYESVFGTRYDFRDYEGDMPEERFAAIIMHVLKNKLTEWE